MTAANCLYFPNGRSPNMSVNGVSYSHYMETVHSQNANFISRSPSSHNTDTMCLHLILCNLLRISLMLSISSTILTSVHSMSLFLNLHEQCRVYV